MISREEYIQLRAFARQDGLLMGAVWLTAFGCFIGSMKVPALEIGFVTGMIATPFVMFLRLKAFRDKVLGGGISYGRAVVFCAMTMAYASLIMTAATMVYFTFIDNGMMMNTLRDNVAIPEVRQSFVQMGMNPAELEKQIEEVGKLRPTDFAISVFLNSIVSSFLLSLFLGLAGRRNTK